MRLLTLCFYCFIIIGCGSSYQNDNSSVMIADGVTFQLISKVPFKHGLRMSQSASVTYQEDSHDLLFQTEVIQDGLTMVGLTPTGTRLFTIQMQQGKIQANGLSAVVDDIKPDYLLADLQLSLWPSEDVGLSLSGAKLLQPSPLKRRLVRNNQTLISIDYSEVPAYKGTISFTHHQRGYSLHIEPVAIETALTQEQQHD